MSKRIDEIRDFFARYEDRANQGLADDVDEVAVASNFTDCFIAANPSGVACGKNDEHLRSQLHQGYIFYRDIGIKRMEIDDMAITCLDDYHDMVRVRWHSLYIDKEEKIDRIDFDVIYLLQTTCDGPKIFGYIIGDEMGALKERGLI
jgi:hypothetical protein